MIGSSFINLGNPLNAAHPLNRGLAGWWAALPQGPYFGGARLLDLCGQNHATLTNGPTWQGALGRSGASESVLFDGTDDYAAIPTAAALNITGDITLAADAYMTVATTLRHVIGGYQNGGAFAGYGMKHATVAGNIEFWDGTGWISSTGAGITAGVWQRWVVSVTGSTASFYVNGVAAGTATTAARASYSGVRAIGQVAGGGGAAFPGYLDNVKIWSRGLTADEVARECRECRLGNPETLNRYARRFAFAPAAGGGGTRPRTMALMGVG